MISKLKTTMMASETLRTGGAAGIIVAARIIGTFGTLLYTVLMARMMTPENFGIAWTLWSIVYIAGYLVTLNIGATAIREVVRARASGDDASAAGFIIVSRWILFIVSIPAISVFIGFIWWQHPSILADYPVAVFLAAATIPVMGWDAINAAQATALDKVLRSQLPSTLVRPLIFIVAFGAIWAFGYSLSLETVLAIFFTAAIMIATVQHVLIWRFFNFIKSVKPDLSGWARWVGSGLLLAPNRLLNDRLKDVLLLVTAVPLGAVGVAKMAVALSIINFLNFAINAVETAFAPKLAQNLTRNLADGVAPRQMTRATHFIAISGVLKVGMLGAGVIALWLILPLLISFYGPEYSASTPLVWWFALIPLSTAVFGNTTLVMQIFDQRSAFFYSSVFGLIMLVVAGVYGVPIIVAYGIDPLIATAMSFAVTMTTLQAYRWVLCWSRTGIDVSLLGALIRRQKHLKQYSAGSETPSVSTT
ncbi:MAG: hypothetical protein KUG69_04555 [Marinosulfonomonas sp.]|nr:hypothetical protein [Marinosulfonomonas sp.]